MISSDCTSFYYFLDRSTLNICYNQQRSLHDIQTYTYAVAVDRALADPMLWVCPVIQGSPKKKITPTFAVDSFRLNVLRDLRVNFLIIIWRLQIITLRGMPDQLPMQLHTCGLYTHTSFFAITSHSNCIYYL